MRPAITAREHKARLHFVTITAPLSRRCAGPPAVTPDCLLNQRPRPQALRNDASGGKRRSQAEVTVKASSADLILTVSLRGTPRGLLQKATVP
ncbi:hypothetical protein E2C01_025477 [Portunus trituberculatus]|uniref:Uncharacterized protein n=1 Tax=Portunus trituberculatus TaxID=210409 RepID=A0A5B7ED09_PORTR|nr:hypothetical protein [Portunus trituberculatus]